MPYSTCLMSMNTHDLPHSRNTHAVHTLCHATGARDGARLESFYAHCRRSGPPPLFPASVRHVRRSAPASPMPVACVCGVSLPGGGMEASMHRGRGERLVRAPCAPEVQDAWAPCAVHVRERCPVPSNCWLGYSWLRLVGLYVCRRV